MGLCGHPVARARAVLRARRLRDGHVPDAPDRARRRLPQPAAGLHGVPRLEGLPLVLELHRAFLVLRGAGGAGPGAARLRVRLVRVPLAHQGRVFRHHHPGADLRRAAAVLQERHRLRRQQRLHRLQAHPRHRDRDAADAGRAVHAQRRGAARHAAAGALAGQLQVRPRAGRDPRRRAARHVLRLQHRALQAVRVDALGGAVRHRRRALRAAGRDHQPERDVARELDRDRDLGRGRRPRHAGRRAARRVRGERREELLHPGLSRDLALLPRAAVHPGDPVPAAGRGRRAAPAAPGKPAPSA